MAVCFIIAIYITRVSIRFQVKPYRNISDDF